MYINESRSKKRSNILGHRNVTIKIKQKNYRKTVIESNTDKKRNEYGQMCIVKKIERHKNDERLIIWS